MESLLKEYSGSTLVGGILQLNVGEGHSVLFELNELFEIVDCSAWEEKGKDETHDLQNAIDDVKRIESLTDRIIHLKNVLKYFKCRIGLDVHGFDNDVAHSSVEELIYDASNDSLWKSIAAKYRVNVNRQLHISTYGTIFMFEPPALCQQVFDASKLRGSAKADRKSLIKLRGTHHIIQHEIRHAPGFHEFIEKIVRFVEENNSNNIAITCRAGHHRSVACAILIQHIYVNATVEHLTINN
jgi:hypothetical protein